VQRRRLVRGDASDGFVRDVTAPSNMSTLRNGNSSATNFTNDLS
jgi:hypothetical protein